MIIVVMGVCGCGKTTIGETLAREISFRDADEFHSQENKEKMSQSIALTDEDRFPWLLAIHKYIKGLIQSNKSGVVTCSALKKVYRSLILQGDDTVEQLPRELVLFVFLNGNAEIINKRLNARKGHFMPPSLLESQLATLEMPNDLENHLTFNVEKSVSEIVHEIKVHVDFNMK